MDKEKEIERMAKFCCFSCEMCESITLRCIEGKASNKCAIAMQAAKNLRNAGYGNVKQALTEFAASCADKMTKKALGIPNLPTHAITFMMRLNMDLEIIYETLKEFLK